MTKKFGSRGAGGNRSSAVKGQSPRKTSDSVKKSIEAWKKGAAGNQKDEKRTAKSMTKKYGTRNAGRSSKKKVAEDIRTPEEILKLTKKFGARRG